MQLQEIRNKLRAPEYDFIRQDVHLGTNMVMLTVGGSHAYGTAHEGSDLDIRGVAVNSPRDILTLQDFEHIKHESTDTIVYSFDKFVKMLCSCNPNVIEMLGLRPEHYLYQTELGRMLCDNKQMFLSKRAAYSFAGFARSQLHQIDTKLSRTIDEAARKRIGKQMMHHVRVMVMGIEILETGNVNTYRPAGELAFYRMVRDGGLCDADGKPNAFFNEYAADLKDRLAKAAEVSQLPEEVNMEKIMDFVSDINRKIVCGVSLMPRYHME